MSDNLAGLQKKLELYFDRLWPICRSITGNGLRQSLEVLKEIIPLTVDEIPTGTKVFDWEIPEEWNIHDAYIITPSGKKIADFKVNNLHVVNYSVPVKKQLSYEELLPHLYTLPAKNKAIPYVTSYYERKWGFCLSYEDYLKLEKQGKYEVVIDSELKQGSLSLADCILRGETGEEILFSTYLCHPSMANNELSGPLALAFLYEKLKKLPSRRYTYRFVIAPETIGAIAYLSRHGMLLKKKVKAGFVVTCCGMDRPFVYKQSRQENSMCDQLVAHILEFSGHPYAIQRFEPFGSDERQYCSPGFNLPVGSLMRAKYHDYEEYHTSLDNKSIFSFRALAETIDMYFSFVKAFELNRHYKNKIMFGEPMLGKREMYADFSLKDTVDEGMKKRLRLINYMDGENDLLSFCERYNYSIFDTEQEIHQLIKNGILE